MEYIKKANIPPLDWDIWFTKPSGIRSFDYKTDYTSLTNLAAAKNWLINEQNGLCAYCQQSIRSSNSSIEHVIPKECSIELSTSYFNLVAVCKVQIRDADTGKFHCDKEKGNKMISPIIFLSNSTVSTLSNNYYFSARADGSIEAKHTLPHDIKAQVNSFINILNLNHKILKERRTKDVLDGLLSVYRLIPPHQKKPFLLNQYNSILNDSTHPFRQFLLIFIGSKIGIN